MTSCCGLVSSSYGAISTLLFVLVVYWFCLLVGCEFDVGFGLVTRLFIWFALS